MLRRIKNWIIVIVAVFTTATVAAVPVSAATLTSLNLSVTSQQVSQQADHTLVFTTPTGVAEGETILVTFDASFDTSSLTEDDVDIDDDGVDLTTAADCSGAEEASVSIAADVVTITVCAGDGGAIAATSEVTVEVGANATASGTGSNQVTNPSSAATYQVRVSGTVGDSGSVWLPILTIGRVGVSLVVPGGGGGGGGPTPPHPGDVTAPIISNVQVVVIGDTEAWITWDTDESANSYVDYGETEFYELGTESDGTMLLYHSITLSDLTPGTLHYFQIRSADNNGNQATSSGYSFTTTDTVAPMISNIEVVEITTSSARVAWETNEPANSVLDYGQDQMYGDQVSSEVLETSHSLTLTGLSEGVEYHFMISSTDAFLNQAQSVDQTFTTLVDNPPANVSGLTVVAGDGQNQLTWTNPNENDLDSVRTVYKIDGYPTGPDDGTVVQDDLSESFLHTGLINNQGYYYGVFVYDLAGQVSSGALGYGLPQADEPPPDEEDPDPDDDDDGDDGDGDDGDVGDGGDQNQGGNVPFCGDGICGQGEDEQSCSIDCPFLDQDGVDPIPETEIEFYVAGNKIELFPINQSVDLLVGSQLRVQIPEASLGDGVDRVELVLDNSLYLMGAAIEDGYYLADVVVPSSSGNYFFAITVYHQGDAGQIIEYVARVNSLGYTFEYVEGEIERVGGSVVTLYSNNGGQFTAWDSSPYSQLNPVNTTSQGEFSWYVPIGEYYIVAEKEGYNRSESEVLYITNNIVNQTVEMALLPPTVEEVVGVITSEDVSLETFSQVADMVGEQLSYTLEEVRQTPYVIESAEILVPVLVGTSVISVSVMAVLFNLLPLMQYLFTAPLLFFWRRKRTGWGVVYNAVTKLPIDLAIVRLYKLPDDPIPGVHPSGGKLMQTRVTDKDGRYFFLVDIGTYRIEVTKPGYSYPSQFLVGVKDDGSYFDIYHGQAIEVTEADATIAANIPLGPAGATHVNTPNKIVFKNVVRRVQRYAATFGLLIAVLVAIIIPSWVTVAVAMAQVLLFVLVKRVTRVRKPKGWGIVYDKQTKKPIAGVAVRIFEPKYNKLLETVMTDKKGRYSFLVGPNVYFTKYEKKGFDLFEYRPIDLENKKEPSEITLDVYLEKQNKTKK